MKNILTIDFEDWFQVFYGERLLDKGLWGNQVSDCERMVNSICELLAERNTSATIFMVGWVADKYPHLVRMLYENGHEIASHGYWHKEVNKMTRNDFINDVKMSKFSIENAIGSEIIGYRAPGYSLTSQDSWAMDVLFDLGFKYDSSLLDMKKSYEKLPAGILEVPPNSLSIFGKHLPINGGFFFRAIPFFFYDKLVKNINKRGVELNFYIHSWEIAPSGYRLPLKGIKKFVQYYNMDTVDKKFRMLLDCYGFESIQRRLEVIGFLK